ncbi:nucleoside hydrolase [Oceanibacterium hippocampi]|uniref:Pyrimidine-specific ribonucleoside hydrolase RihA n=1 Tax=Oceanibacterium hippocampi TaxID=745714 RepID=A0A1Y5TY09_9PROT|nr:nucleoside hydrolase [Oceanibacterium hippocampi]SLN76258.1 Pyrimidine-specific ribonucleoside hydrolase RihA [Oceanibacterium hippocampi]
MAPRPIIIDCDPGQDDAVALALAMASPDELEILGVTAVAGNVPLRLTERNARIMCELCGRTDVAVYAGADRPMVRDLVTAEEVHGETGLNGIEIYEPVHPLQPKHAVDFIIETLAAAADDGVTLVPTGPLTNIALAIRRAPSILPKIREIVLMGGAMREGGNSTPSAEFNILVDPHAAHIVFRCGRPIVAMGLDVTHQVMTTAVRVAAIEEAGGKAARAIVDLLRYYERHDEAKYGSDGGPLHDPCTIAYLLRPELFSLKHVHVAVETASELTMGHTAVDFWRVTGKPLNAHWAHHVDADGFFALLTERLARL